MIFSCPKCYASETKDGNCPECGTRLQLQMTPSEQQENSIHSNRIFFDEKHHFIPKWLGDTLLIRTKFVTWKDTRQVWAWNGKFYEDGEPLIETACKELLGQDFKSGHCEETKAYIRAATYQDREAITLPIHLLPLQNGLLDLKTKTLGDYTSDYFYTGLLEVAHDANATCPECDKFFEEILSPDQRVLARQVIAMTLWADNTPFQKSVMLLGEGSNGKSVYLSLVQAILGRRNVANVTLQQLCGKEARFVTSRLFMKRANICYDLPKQSLKDTGLWKQLVAGDWVDAEEKFRAPYAYKPFCKMFFSANELPSTRDITDAFFRRWFIFKFDNKFSKEAGNIDVRKTEKITTQQELSGFLNELLLLLDGILETGEFASSASVDEIKHEYLISSDPVSAFCEKYVTEERGSQIKKEDLWTAFLYFSEEVDVKISRESFFLKFKRLFSRAEFTRSQVDSKRISVVNGVRLDNDFLTEAKTNRSEKYERDDKYLTFK